MSSCSSPQLLSWVTSLRSLRAVATRHLAPNREVKCCMIIIIQPASQPIPRKYQDPYHRNTNTKQKYNKLATKPSFSLSRGPSVTPGISFFSFFRATTYRHSKTKDDKKSKRKKRWAVGRDYAYRGTHTQQAGGKQSRMAQTGCIYMTPQRIRRRREKKQDKKKSCMD